MADVAARLKATRAELTTHGPEPGRPWCDAWTDALDAGLLELIGSTPLGPRITLVAMGGYGRRELCPGSDVDLLLLHDGLEEPQLEVVVRDVVYPLWDAGLKVGYAVRDRKRAVAEADDLDTGTATLDGRVVAGAHDRFAIVRGEILRRLGRRRDRFLGALTEADRERRARAGDAAEVLEPDLKNGAGGLRDVQSLRWAAAALVGEVGLDPLVPARYLGAADRARLARAYDQLLRIRVGLHLVVDHPTDVLRLDLQQEVAERLGYEDGDDERDTAAHRLLTDHFLAARTVEHVHRRAWVLVDADARQGRRRHRASTRLVEGLELVADGGNGKGGARARGGVLRLPDGADPADPSLPGRLLAALVDTGAVLDRETATRLRRLTDERDEPLPWGEDLRRRFLRALWAGDQAIPAFAELDDVGLLTALIPEWAPTRGRPQRNPFHRYSLDRHALHAAAALAELVRHEAWAATTLEAVEDRDALMLGALLHDIGKAYGEPHSESGAPIAGAVVTRIGCDEATRDRVERLVREHLTLPDVATRRDVSDPDEAVAVARAVGDRQTLAALHLLAAADGTATGPTAWTTWKATLVDQLTRKVRAVLDETDPDALADGAEATAAAAQQLAPTLGVEADEVRRHLALLPSRYAAAVSPRSVVRHAGLAAAPLATAEIRTRVAPGELTEDGVSYDELDVVALDTPGLFAKVAGVLALHGGSVLQASAYTRDDGVAVDTFIVVKPDQATGSWWAQAEGDLVEAVGGRLAVRARVARKRAGEERRLRRVPDVPTKATTSRDPSGRLTVLEVHTLDRIGVLYRIASALAELELDLVVAKVLTMGFEVVDTFYVRDADGQPLDEDHTRELDLAVTAALAE